MLWELRIWTLDNTQELYYFEISLKTLLLFSRRNWIWTKELFIAIVKFFILFSYQIIDYFDYFVVSTNYLFCIWRKMTQIFFNKTFNYFPSNCVCQLNHIKYSFTIILFEFVLCWNAEKKNIRNVLSVDKLISLSVWIENKETL